VGWKLKASRFRRSRRRPSEADPWRTSKPQWATGAEGSGRAHSQCHIGSATSRVIPAAPLPSVVGRKAAVITFRRSTAVRAGVAAVVLGALSVGFAVGWVISSPPPSPSTDKVVTEAATTPMSPPSETATPATAVASCKLGSKVQVRPTTIDIGCHGDISISTVTWSSWGTSTGSGSGTLTVNNCQPSCATGSVSSSPAFVVLSDPVGGVFQDVLITPPSGAMPPQSSSHPGSGWGSG
jgi:hypothetical protein